MLRTPLIHKNKKRARILLYGGATIVPLAVWALSALLSKPLRLDVSWDIPAAEYEAIESVHLLQEYLRIDTSGTTGNEIPGAEFLARQLEAAGIKAHIERLGERNANVWAFLEGEDPRALVLHNHIDVDPVVEPERWKLPPFAGEIDVPWIFGRGAFDMKSLTIAQLLATIELARQKVPLRRSVLFLATGDEETGSRLGTSWILREHPELVSQMDVVLTEGGVVEATERHVIKYWGTETAQKRYVEIYACHQRQDRLIALHDDIEGANKHEFARHLDTGTARFLTRYGPTRDHPGLARLMSPPQRYRFMDGTDMTVLPLHVQLMIRNDVAASEPIEDLAGGYRMRIILALLPGVTVEDALDELLPSWMTHGVALSFDERHGPGEPSSQDHPVYVALDRFMQEEAAVDGGIHGPYVVTQSATDARFFRAAGITTFGYSPFVLMTTDTLQMKAANERIALPAFIEGVDRYVRLVKNLVGV